MRVWILQTGEPMPVDTDGSRPMRAMNLAGALTAAGHEVVIWTADFNHIALTARYGRNTRVRMPGNLEVRFVKSPGYGANLSPSRMIDHGLLAIELSRLLRNETTKPDVAFIGFPPIEPAAVMVQWLQARGVPTLVDLKDAWPDVLLRAFPPQVQPVARLALMPYYRMARRCLARATGLSSTTQDFLDWTVAVAGRSQRPTDIVLPLTSPSTPTPAGEKDAAGEWLDSIGVPEERLLRVAFVGALHSSYDFAPVARAARRADSVQFVICGDGSRFRETSQLMEGLPNVVMPGWVSTAQAAALARRSDLALIPIAPHPDYLLNVTNKFYDAIEKGLPVLTGLGGALGRVVTDEDVGWVYGSEAGRLLEEIIDELVSDPSPINVKSRNARALYLDKYEFGEVYSRAVLHLEELADSKANAVAQGWLPSGADSDRLAERDRYDRRANDELVSLSVGELPVAVDDQAEVFQPPYRAYERSLRETIRHGDVVLELGAGSGRHTVAITGLTDASVALDIAVNALKVCRERTRGRSSVVSGDLEALPFAVGSVDVVVCAGSLSYGDPALVDREILRVLRPGGSLVLVDSLNHNPVYRLNRWRHFRAGDRTASTVSRTPRVDRLEALAAWFESSDLQYFGTFDFLYPALRRIAGEQSATRTCQALDARWGANRYGFKFVLSAQGKRS